jgi:hypothetical protein
MSIGALHIAGAAILVLALVWCENGGLCVPGWPETFILVRNKHGTNLVIHY